MGEERTDQETQARQAERLALLATLARPVQHEINNLLTVIFANLDMLKRRVTEETPQRQLGRVQEAARRFEASTRAILSLTRRPVPNPALISPAQAVRMLEPLLAVLLPAPAALAVDLAETPACRFDQALLDGALIALARGVAGKGSLGITAAARPGLVTLELRLPPGSEDAAAVATLRGLAMDAGGELTEAPGLLRLSLPVADQPGSAA